jgi:hypothetical protein
LFLVLAATITIATALAHMSCIYFGPECYSLQMAPPFVVKWAQEGSYLAALAAVVVSSIFIVMGLYALSGAGLIRRLPLLKLGLYTITTVCIIRGLLGMQLWLRHQEKIDVSVFYVGLVWLVVGLLYLFGCRMYSSKITKAEMLQEESS